MLKLVIPQAFLNIEIEKQHNVDKIKNDIIIGKLGEIAAYKYITSKGRVCTYPDFNVYQAYEKTYEADLFSNDNKIHVKTQDIDSANRFGTSWMFQKNDTLTFSPSEKEFILLSVLDSKNMKVMIKKIEKASYFIGKYKEPIKESLRGNKLTIYLSDL